MAARCRSRVIMSEIISEISEITSEISRLWRVRAVSRAGRRAGPEPCTWTLAREFIWGARFPEPLVMVDWTAAGDVAAGSEEVLHYVRDALGSVVGLLDAGEPDATPEPVPAKLVERYDYDPYGKTYIAHWDPAAGSGSGDWVRHAPDEPSAYGNPFMWTGQRHDVAIGLYHFPFRTYSPRLGRWLQRDPLGYVDGVNMYEYVASRPLGMVDPTGLQGAPAGPPLGRKKFEWDGEQWNWSPSDPHNQAPKDRLTSPHWDSPTRRIFPDGTIQSKQTKQRWKLSKSDLKGLKGKGVTFALLLSVVGEQAVALDQFVAENAFCRAWYEAGLRGDVAGMQAAAEECYGELLDAGHYHAALNFHRYHDYIESRVAERVAEERKRKKQAEREEAERAKQEAERDSAPECGK